MAFDRPVLAGTPGLSFWRLLGSGRGTSMSPGADLRRWALFAVWRRESALDDFLEASPIAARWREEAQEHWQVRLAPLASRGRWNGIEPFGLRPVTGTAASVTGGNAPGGAGARGACEANRAGSVRAGGTNSSGDTGPGGEGDAGRGVTRAAGEPVAVLTRASIRLSRLAPFYRSVPRVDRLLRERDGCLASVGVGEWPLVRQATFSLWRDADAVRDFAYRSQAHRRVIERTRAEDWYSEELFARFAPYGSEGSWNGTDPLTRDDDRLR
ncbi:hypothetical protein GCM10017600_23810 [Streptosporangium carneum]|uniref:Spheroidene monooxygenase n=2 Tax=Streptosporangium carneum TaxID=47481 RepID=A0A9W6I0Z9_9ACTN|nr:hypothetical protein GCM10017600_23810 [Streptosporangium carneum]